MADRDGAIERLVERIATKWRFADIKAFARAVQGHPWLHALLADELAGRTPTKEERSVVP